MRCLTMVVILIAPSFMLAQKSFTSQASMQDALRLAKNYMIAYQGDKALPITQSLMDRLKASDRYNTSFGFQVRLIHGLSLIRSTEEASSFNFLWHLRDESKAYGEWAVYAQACRGIAFVLELSDKPEEAFQNLWQALTVIKKYQLDSIYAPVAIRHSSVHRIYGNLDSARYFATEALRIAPQFGQTLEEASGNFLMSIFTSKEDEKLAYLKKAAKLYKKIGELKTFVSMHNNLAELYLKKGEAQKAMLHADTAIYFHKYIPEKESRDGSRGLEFKAEAFQQLGALDSTIFYLKKAHAAELANIENRRKDLMAEVDRKYNMERKTEELATEREKSWLLGGVASLFILLTIGLVYSYLKLRKANQLARRQAEELKVLDQAKSRFFANISHELRTPLALMLGPVQFLLKNRSSNARRKELLHMVRRSGKRLEYLVNEILDLKKLQSNKMFIELSPTNLGAFYRLHAGQFSSLAESKKIKFIWDIHVEKKTVVALDQEKCRQILYNLLSNAFKYTAEGGQIDLSVHLDSKVVRLAVEDTGLGIHPDDLPNLFDPYFQTNRLEKPIEGGTGIGLAICQEYVQLLGGQIQVESALGQGTRFSCWYPVEILKEEDGDMLLENDPFIDSPLLKRSLNAKNNLGKAAKSHSETKKPRLLVVEDNPDLRAYIKIILEERYQLTLVENGKQALEALADASQFQLILSDIMMPVMDGFQLLEALKSNQRTRHIPILMLTARAAPSDKLNALRIGVDDYMVKPFEEEELLVRIENLLNNYFIRISFSQEEKKDLLALPIMSDPDREWLTAFESFVRENLDLANLTITMLTDKFAMSESTLLRQLKRLTGLSPQQYIIEVRMTEARRLVEKRKFGSMKRVAFAVGYKDARAFSRAFKKRFGTTPSEILEA